MYIPLNPQHIVLVCLSYISHYIPMIFWDKILVGGRATPLKNMSSSVGTINGKS